MKYYLCGPIDTAGKKEDNIYNMELATHFLRNVSRLNIINPIEENSTHSDWAYTDYLRADIKNMMECGAIILLKGWCQSRGARNELKIALELDMPVFYFDIETDDKLVDMNFY